MKELYMANMWPQIITKRGSRLFENAGYEVTGNWLNGEEDYRHASKILLPYADFGKAVLIAEVNPEIWKKVFSYILFPDSMVGWDLEKKTYLFQRNQDAAKILNNSIRRLSHSNYSSGLANQTYLTAQDITIPLGIDTNTIHEVPWINHDPIRVLWNHMWRSDKGAIEAFELIQELAKKNPKVEFWIGQSDTWSTRPDVQSYKERCESKLKILQNMDNVKFFNRIYNQQKYWQWLKQVDIAFSTAFQEGFGLSMMEQEAAGLACVVPNAEAYPELHAGCLIIERDKLAEGIEKLIHDSASRKYVSQGCIDNSSKYDTSTWVKNILENIS